MIIFSGNDISPLQGNMAPNWNITARYLLGGKKKKILTLHWAYLEKRTIFFSR